MEAFVSVVLGGFVGAVLTALVAFALHRRQESASTLSNLRETIAKIIDIREEIAALGNVEDQRSRDMKSGFLFAKRALYLGIAEEAARNQAELVSAPEWNILAQEHLFDSSFVLAKEYFDRSLKSAQLISSKVVAHRSLGEFYCEPHDLQDLEKGDYHFLSAVELLKDNSDHHSTFVKGSIFEQHGLILIHIGCESKGKEKIEEARKIYRELPPSFGPDTVPPDEILAQRLEEALALARRT